MDRVLMEYPADTKARMRRKFVLLAVASLSVDGRTSRPRLDDLADRAKGEIGATARHMATLVEEGWLTIIERGGGRGKATVYELAESVRGCHGNPRKTDPKPAQKEEHVDEPHVLLEEEINPTKTQQETEPVIALATVTEIHPGKLLEVPSVIDVVFRAWQGSLESWRRSTGRRASRVILSPKREKLILARLDDGFDVDDLVDAVRGWRRSPFHCGENDRRKPYNSLELILRDVDHVEQFRDMERDADIIPISSSSVPDPAVDAVNRMRRMEGRA